MDFLKENISDVYCYFKGIDFIRGEYENIALLFRKVIKIYLERVLLRGIMIYCYYESLFYFPLYRIYYTESQMVCIIFFLDKILVHASQITNYI